MPKSGPKPLGLDDQKARRYFQFVKYTLDGQRPVAASSDAVKREQAREGKAMYDAVMGNVSSSDPMREMAVAIFGMDEQQLKKFPSKLATYKEQVMTGHDTVAKETAAVIRSATPRRPRARFGSSPEMTTHTSTTDKIAV